MALTDAKVRQAVPRAKSYTLRDSGGLLLFVAPNGAKHWHFRFSWKGRRARISFGSYPLIGLRQARLLRDEARVQLAQGVDPRTGRTTRRCNGSDDGTFAALAERWFAFKSPRWSDTKKGTDWQAKLYLDKDILEPWLVHSISWSVNVRTTSTNIALRLSLYRRGKVARKFPQHCGFKV